MLCKGELLVILCKRCSISCPSLWFCSVLESVRRKGALEGLVSAAWEKWVMTMSERSIQIIVVGLNVFSLSVVNSVERMLVKWRQAPRTVEFWSLIEVWGFPKGLVFYFCVCFVVFVFVFIGSGLEWQPTFWGLLVWECFKLLPREAGLLDHFLPMIANAICRQCLVPHLKPGHFANFPF